MIMRDNVFYTDGKKLYKMSNGREWFYTPEFKSQWATMPNQSPKLRPLELKDIDSLYNSSIWKVIRRRLPDVDKYLIYKELLEESV